MGFIAKQITNEVYAIGGTENGQLLQNLAIFLESLFHRMMASEKQSTKGKNNGNDKGGLTEDK